MDASAEPQTGPLRRCIVTRARLPKEQMIRFVLGPERTLALDLAAKLPGRGIWLSARHDVLETARTHGALTKAFARAARGPVKIPENLADALQVGLARRIGELLGLARRAGQAVGGFQRAREWVQSGRAGLVLQASDGSAEERARFLAGAGGEGRSFPVLTPLSAAAMGAVFGRDHMVHVAVSPGRLAAALVNETRRLSGIAGAERPGATMKAEPADGAMPDGTSGQ
jgi:uncharacterized protein